MVALAQLTPFLRVPAAEGYACAEEGGYLVGLDTRLTDDLRIEGLALELMRTVQDARKQADFEVSDRISLRLVGSAGVEAALAAHRDLIMSETFAIEWGDEQFEGTFTTRRELDDESWSIFWPRLPSFHPFWMETSFGGWRRHQVRVSSKNLDWVRRDGHVE